MESFGVWMSSLVPMEADFSFSSVKSETQMCVWIEWIFFICCHFGDIDHGVKCAAVKCEAYMSFLMGQDKVEVHVQLNGEFIMLYHVFLRSSHMNIYLYNIIYMFILRVIRIIWIYCTISHVCNKIATKINYALNHHEFVCQRMK